MTEQRSPDEEPIIELTEVVEPAAVGDDDIIELTDVVESSPPENEEIIELTDIVQAPQAEEEILELVDVVEEPMPVETPISEAPVDRPEEIEAELTDQPDENGIEAEAVVPEDAFDLFADTASNAAASKAAGDEDIDFAPMDLDIEENKEEDLFDSLGMKLEPELKEGEGSDELDFNLSTQELSDAIDLLDAKLAEEPPAETPADAAPAGALPPTLSEAQFKDALQNVIRKMFAEKIDMLINEAIEKNVTAEIELLKNQLLKDSTED